MENRREEFCRDSVDRFIGSNLRAFGRHWEPVANDPPDFYLRIDDKSFAVEVTSTKVARQASLGEGTILEETYEATHMALINDLETATNEAGILKGVYVIEFDRPMDTAEFQRTRKVVQGKLQRYIEETQALESFSYDDIMCDGEKICRISKLGKEGNRVFVTFCDGAWTESPEEMKKASDLLQQAITVKKDRLLAKSRDDPRLKAAPKVLILLNTYAWATADPAMYWNCIPHIQSLEYFHSVFIVWSDGSCSLLHSTDQAWLSSPRGLRNAASPPT